MSKRVINVTTDRHGNEDFRLWDLDPDDDEVAEFPAGDSENRVLVIRGSGLGKTYDAENDRDTYKTSLDRFESEISSFIAGADEIGVLYHPKELYEHVESIDRVLDSKDLAFFEYYSTSDEVLYEKYYQPLAEEHGDPEAWEDYFDDLWTYCNGDLVLEAKLELLHALLVPPSDLSASEEDTSGGGAGAAWAELIQVAENDSDEPQENVETYRDAWRDFKDADPAQYKDDPSGSGYYDDEGPLTELRDKLLAPA